jgi:hypothetical protein
MIFFIKLDPKHLKSPPTSINTKELTHVKNSYVATLTKSPIPAHIEFLHPRFDSVHFNFTSKRWGQDEY